MSVGDEADDFGVWRGRRLRPRRAVCGLGADSPGLRAGPLGVQLGLNEREDVIGLGVAAEHRLGEHECPVEVHVEDPVRARDDLDRRQVVLVLLE
jgi:hypothetical protein